MPATMLNLGGRKFVVLPEKEYRELKAKAARNGKPVRTNRRLTRQDRGDIAESIRRLANEPSIPAEQVFKKLGL
jgi:hypothetical protein